jgi:hypothetical protein
MVETRMDAMIARAASQARPMGPRPAGERITRPQTEQVLEARPAKAARDIKAIEADVARIFAKRAFQATQVDETRISTTKEGPRGGRLDIRA